MDPLIPSTMPRSKYRTIGSDTAFERAAQPAEIAPLYVFQEASSVTERSSASQELHIELAARPCRTSVRSVIARALVVLGQLATHLSRHIQYCSSGLFD